MITPKEINAQIKEAIRMFGEYNYFDKTSEVLDFQSLYNKMSKMSGKEVADILTQVRKTNKKYGEEFVRHMLYCLQDVENFDDLYEDKRISDLF